MAQSTPSSVQGRLANRVALITGASSGLGRATAYLFASEGATVCLLDKYLEPRNPVNAGTGKADDWNSRLMTSALAADPTTDNDLQSHRSTLDLISSKYGSDKALSVSVDLTEELQVQHAVQKCIETYRRIDILVNCAGISVESTHPKPLRCHETTLSDFELTVSINATATFLTCKHVLSQYLSQDQLYPGGRGWIINVASVQGLTPYYATPSYCASKGAVVMLTKQIALDYAKDSIRCNSVCPGFLDTNMTRNLQGDAELLKSVAERHPLNTTGVGSGGGLGKVEDVARMILVMASDDVRWMTGVPVVVDGGYMLS